MTSPKTLAAREWAEAHFGDAELRGQRRVERVITIGTALMLYPARSIPQLFATRSDIKATYKLLNCPEATPEAALECAEQYATGLWPLAN